MDVLLILFLLFWIPGAFLIGYVASQKGRDGFTWGILSLIVSPLITLIALAVLSSASSTQPLRSSSTEGSSAEPPVEDMTKKCPQCAEFVKSEALICRFCRYEFPPVTELEPHAPQAPEAGPWRVTVYQPSKGKDALRQLVRERFPGISESQIDVFLDGQVAVVASGLSELRAREVCRRLESQGIVPRLQA